MFVERREDGVWSARALLWLKISFVMTVVLSLLDGVVHVSVRSGRYASDTALMISYWVIDFRYLFEQGLLVAAVLFVGAKLFEGRTVLMLGFDRADAARITLKGPDEENVVWIGRRYDSALEAEAVAEAAARKIEGAREPS